MPRPKCLIHVESHLARWFQCQVITSSTTTFSGKNSDFSCCFEKLFYAFNFYVTLSEFSHGPCDFRDALIVSLTNSFTSILAGFVIFSAVGYMAHIHHLPVDNIATDGEIQQFFHFKDFILTRWASLCVNVTQLDWKQCCGEELCLVYLPLEYSFCLFCILG